MAPRLLANARRLLDLLSEEGPQPVAQLSGALNMPRSTVLRLVEGLIDIDLVRSLPNGALDLSVRWLALADAASAARAEWGQARQMLQRLAQETGCTTTLSVYLNATVTCLAWVPGRVNEVLQVKPGRSLPPHAGAEGRAILSALEDAELAALLAGAPFEAYTPRTMITRDELIGDVARSRRQGYTLSFDDAWPGIGSIAAPIRDPIKSQLGSIALSSTSDEVLIHASQWSAALLEITNTH